MNKLYLECASGISGDMLVAALIDLGVDRQMLEKALKSIPAKGFEIEISRVKKSSLDVCDFNVRLDDKYENHDHDMAYLHGSGEKAMKHEHITHSHDGHVHGGHTHDDHGHDGHTHDGHDHSGHDHHSHHHSHEHRGMKEVTDIINGSDITANARRLALRVFEILGRAEAKAHGSTLAEVHFHEVGAIDSIVDIVAAAVCLDSLDVDDVIIPVLYEGRGTIRCQHGILPIPVPAVANIAAEHHLRLHITDCYGELVTPTGAAIAAAFRTTETLPEHFTVQRTGLGGGKRTYECPGFLRAMLIKEEGQKIKAEHTEQDSVYVIETNIDDCSGEALGYVMEQLLRNGARDVSYSPIFMKKNRPAYQLTVICAEQDVPAMETLIFRDTTAIGVRKVKMERTILKRELKTVQTSLGDVRVKLCRLPGAERQLRVYPEYDSVATLSRNYGKPFQDIYQQIMRECSEQV